MDLARHLLPWAFAFLALQSFYAVPYRLGELAQMASSWRHGAAVASASLALGLGLALRRPLAALSGRLFAGLAAISPARWLCIIIAAGAALRLGWVLTFGFVVESDGATYLDLARKLASGAAYETAGTRAYWPPGFPLFLAPLIFLFGSGPAMLVILNLVLYGVTITGVFALARRLAGDGAAKAAIAMLALWPNFIGLAGTLEKETLIIALLPWLAHLLTGAPRRDGPGAGATLAAGLLLGALCLVQPSFILFFPVPMAGWAIARRPPRVLAVHGALLLTGMALAIAPWSLRNYQVFGQFVLISTNGGHNLYRANNPWADGTWQPAGARSHQLADADEVTIDKTAKSWAFEWIRENSGAFAALALRKQLLFLGDASGGMASLRAGGRQAATSPLWIAAKLLGNGFWLGMWGVMLAACLAALRAGVPLPRWMAALGLYFLYFYAIHSVFESGAKYHLVTLGILAVLFGAFADMLRKSPVEGARS